MRADRLIRIMVLLQNHTKMTTRELSNELGVSERTILRDMDALTLSGIPVVAERGKTGGWRLMDHFRSQLSGLKLQDMKALFILPSEQLLEDLGVQVNGGDLRSNLLASLPSSIKAEGRHYLEKLYVDTSTWKSSKEKSDVFLMVQKALWEDKKLSMTYQKTDGVLSERVVCPLGLVAKGSVWYLVALNENGEYRNFRLARIVQAVRMEEEFSRPEHFSLSDYWKQSKVNFVQSLPSYKVEVLVAPTIMNRMTFTDKFVNIIAIGTEQHDSRVPVTLDCNTEQEAITYVLGYGGAMKVVQPQALREKIVQQAKAAIDMYDIDQSN